MKKIINELKKKYPDAVILCHLGDYYTCYGGDAAVVADVLHLGITDNVCLFPFYALDTYLPRLVRAGKRVVIAG